MLHQLSALSVPSPQQRSHNDRRNEDSSEAAWRDDQRKFADLLWSLRLAFLWTIWCDSFIKLLLIVMSAFSRAITEKSTSQGFHLEILLTK
jgi:hypothetical protein